MTENVQDQNNRTTQMARIVDDSAYGYTQLVNLLNIGPDAISRQIRYVMMLSQVLGKKASIRKKPEKPMTLNYARLHALVDIADTLSEKHLENLYKEIKQIRNTKVRLILLLHVANLLPHSVEIIHDVVKQVQTLADPAAEAEVMFLLAPLLPEEAQEDERPSKLAQVIETVLHLSHMDARIKGLIALRSFILPDDLETYIRAILDELYEEQDDELSSQSLRTLAEYLPETSASNALALVERIRSLSFRAYALTALAQYLPLESHRYLHEKALDTIAQIEDEPERAEALIAFTTNLEIAEEEREYPKLLEQALQIAISIETGSYRARVLVALAPNLTDDLQREALAAVQQLDIESEKSHLLNELIPMLSEDMLLKALDIAQALEGLEFRAQVLTCLAQYVPQHVRQQTMMDALYAASNLPNPYERVQALVDIRYWLPHVLQDEVLHRTLDTIENMDNNSAKSLALNYLAEHLNIEQLEDALEIAREISNPQTFINAVLGFLPYVSDELKAELLNELLDSLNHIRLPYKRAQVLTSLAPYLAPHQLLQVLDMAESIIDASDQINVYASLAQQLPKNDRELTLNKALIRLKRITDGYTRANAMISLIPHLEVEKRKQLQMEIYQTIERAKDAYEKAGAIALLAPLLEGESLESISEFPNPITMLHKAFERTLHIPEQQTRADLLKQGVYIWLEYSDADTSYTLWKTLAKSLITLPLSDVLLCLESLRPVLQQFAGKDYTKAVAYILGMR